MRQKNETLGERLRQLRKRATLTTKELADAVGTTQSHLCAIENGRVESPRYKLLRSLANYFGMTISEFIGEQSNGNQSAEAELISRWYDHEISEGAKQVIYNTIDAFRRQHRQQ